MEKSPILMKFVILKPVIHERQNVARQISQRTLSRKCSATNHDTRETRDFFRAITKNGFRRGIVSFFFLL